MEVMSSMGWLKNQIREFEEEYENQSDNERCMFIDGKLTILKLWLNEKIKNNMMLEVEFMDKGIVENHLSGCEGKHVQQVVYSTYHKALTQVCFGCEKVRTSLKSSDTKGGLDE